MKHFPRSFFTGFLALASCAFFASSAAVRADDGQQGGAIDGTESLDVEMAMTPTAAAPAGSSVDLSLETEDDEGATTAKLQLETTALPAGTYFVNVTLKSTGGTVALGSFTSNGTDAEVEFGSEEGIPFPPTVNPFDIATVVVADANGVALFTADLTSIAAVTSEVMSASLNGRASATAPNATASASLSGQVLNHVASGSLTLTAHGLPAGAKLNVTINGIKAKKVSADSAGNATISFLPKPKTGAISRGVSLFGVRNVQLQDAKGNVLLNTSF